MTSGVYANNIPISFIQEKKEEICLGPYTNCNRKFQKSKWQHKNATKTFDYLTIADQGRSVRVTTATQRVWLHNDWGVADLGRSVGVTTVAQLEGTSQICLYTFTYTFVNH